MKATGEVMSICNNFEGALMKAIRSLEQHVDCLRSYDFSALSVEELLERLKIVDDQRIYVIAEAIRKGISYEQIHDITKIDLWFIDKIAILTEMEHALETQPLTVELLKEAKRIEFPDNVIARLTGKTEQEIKKMRYDNGIKAVYKMVDTCAQSSQLPLLIITPYSAASAKPRRPPDARKSWYWVPVLSVSDRVSSSTIVPYMLPGHFPRQAMRPLSSTTTRRL